VCVHARAHIIAKIINTLQKEISDFRHSTSRY